MIAADVMVIYLIDYRFRQRHTELRLASCSTSNVAYYVVQLGKSFDKDLIPGVSHLAKLHALNSYTITCKRYFSQNLNQK